MKEQLTIKELAPYLPYGLKFQDSKKNKYNLVNLSTRVLSVINIKGYGNIEKIPLKYATKKFKPLLRPLSNLTEEIEHNGERFYPIEKLKEDLQKDWCDSFNDYLNYIHDACYSSDAILQGSYKIIQKLLEWHFDVFGLIDKKLAVDINTING